MSAARLAAMLLATTLLATSAAAHAQVAPPTAADTAPPSVQAYLDSAALHAALVQLAPSPATRRIAHVFRVEFDSAGRPRAAHAAAPRVMARAYRDAVAPLVTAALRPIDPRPDGRQVLLLVEAGASPRIAEITLPQQRPSVANLGRLGHVLHEEAQAIVNADTTLLGRELTARVSMRVDEDGIASLAAIERSSGRADVDAAALRATRIIRLRPALLDGEPVPVRVVLPIRFVFPAED